MNKYLLVGVVAILIIGAGGWWYVNQSNVPVTSETTQVPTGQTAQQNTNTGAQSATNNSTTAARTISGTGFEATAPTLWKVNSQTNSYVSISSPEYVATSQTEMMQAEMQGKALGLAKEGAMIEIVPQGENELSTSVQDPAAYVRFRINTTAATGQTMNKEISLAGQAAWLLQVRRDNGAVDTYVQTVRNGKEFLITLHAASESSIDSATWNAFLASIKFR